MHAPRRRGTRIAATTALLIAVAACGDDEALDPQVRAPALGAYTYEAVVHTEEGAEPQTYAGTLVLDVSSEDSIIGTWQVDGFGSQARGIWNITAYALGADPAPPVRGAITHRVWRSNGSDNLSCALTYQHEMPADTFMSSSENSCLLERQ